MGIDQKKVSDFPPTRDERRDTRQQNNSHYHHTFVNVSKIVLRESYEVLLILISILGVYTYIIYVYTSIYIYMYIKKKRHIHMNRRMYKYTLLCCRQSDGFTSVCSSPKTILSEIKDLFEFQRAHVYKCTTRT